MKKILSIVLLFTMIIGFGSVTASATTMSPQYTYISEVSNCLEPEGKILYIDASTSGYFNATKCAVTATLQKKSGSSWTTYKSWSKTEYSDYVLFTTSITVSSGEYRLVTSHSVTVGSATEYEGMTSDVVDV